jgi:hypothetical protein
VDDASQHLVSTANSQHLAAASGMSLEVDVPALRPQRVEIGDRRLRAGQQHEVGADRQRLAPAHHHHAHARLGPERVEVVEIGDVRQERHRDGDPSLAG